MKPVWPSLFALIVIAVWLFTWMCGWPSYMTLWHSDGGFSDKAFACFLAVMTTSATAIVTAGVIALGCGLASLIGGGLPQVWSQCWQGEMVSMRNADGETGSLHGGLFMMVGTIGQSSTYFYYTTTNDGGFRQQQWTPDGNTTIYEEDRKDGQLTQYKRKFAHPWMDWIGSPEDVYRMEFHIPKGSIQKQFSIK